ncbi:MAG: DUF308 domain-containing protein [Candidatus Aenigmarchaeota archaeon]|nr:DUF308 domain-containing protein [Candidatus Aenigmarchaeota archaeon]
MIDIIIAAVLIAFGIIVLARITEAKYGDQRALLVLIIGISCILAGAWLILSAIGAVMFVLTKILGLLLLAAGIFYIGFFPDVKRYQREGMSNVGIFIGFILAIIGFYLVFLMW